MLSWEQIGKQNWELDGSTLRTFWDHYIEHIGLQKFKNFQTFCVP
jgi:hypothetical protein